MTLSEKLKGIVIPKFHPVAWDEVLMRVSIEEECGLFKSCFRLFIGLLRSSFSGYSFSNSFETKDNNTIFYYYNNTGRSSCERQFDNVTALASGDVLKEKVDKTFNLVQCLFLIFVLFPIWFFSLFGRGLTLKEKLVVVSNLRALYGIKLFIETIDLKKYKLFTCFYDSIVSANYLLHVFKLYGFKTATLQHGSFLRYKTNILEMSGVEFRSSFSDYFLIWNNDQFNEAVVQGIPQERLKIVGILGFIGAKRDKCKKTNCGEFGVSISHPSWEAENFVMINAANILAKAIGMKYKLKLHPNYPEDYFNKYVDFDYYIGNATKGIPMFEYANSVDFTIVGSSSVLNEMVYLHHNTIRYSSKDITDKFINVTVGQKFTNPEDIVAVYNDMIDKGDDSLSEMFDCLCTIEDVDNKYREFFNQY